MQINNKPLDTDQVLQSAPQQQGSSTSKRAVIHLWERMNHLYGHKWAATYGESAVTNNTLTDVAKTWATGLNGVSPQQIADGLHACCKSGEGWPPTLPMFRKMCLGENKNDLGLDYRPPYHSAYRITEPSRLLSNTERDEQRANVKKKINMLREALR